MAVAGRGTLDNDYVTAVDITDMCELCDVRSVSGYCLECEMNICQSCFDRHRRSKNNRNHVLQGVTEKKTGLTPIRFDVCAEHARHDVKLYCTDHNVPGCAECMLFEHKACKYEYITEAANRFEESGERARVFEDIQMLENTHAECISAIVSKTEATEMMSKHATDEIETFTESIITYIVEAKHRALEEVNMRQTANKLQLDKLENGIQAIGSQIEALKTAFLDEKQLHKLFILSIETKPKLSSIRDAFSNIDCSSIMTDHTLQTSTMLQDMVSNSRSVCRFEDDSQNQIGDDNDLEFLLKQERKKSQQAQQQVSQQENELQTLTSNMRKLEGEHITLKKEYDKTVHERKQLESEINKFYLEVNKTETKKQIMRNEVILSCGHTRSIEKMEKNRTIRCNKCNIPFGDQPVGTMESTVKTYYGIAEHTYYEIQFKLPEGKQSKLNCNPGNSYTGFSMTGYLRNDEEGIAILKMLRQAFDRKLLFTVDCKGSITLGGIELFKETPYWSVMQIMVRPQYPGYIARVKKQLAAVGITN